MKKSLIATGAASLALAAMPAVGVFATTSTVTDTLNVNIPAACTIRNDVTQGEDDATPVTENVYNVTMKNGEFRNDIGQGADGVTGSHDSTIDVNCNIQSGTDAGWVLSAAGKGGVNTLAVSGGTEQQVINSNLNENGATSGWAFKTAASGVTYQTGYATDTFAIVPASPANIAKGTGNATFTMTYQVYVSTTQPTGLYTGGVVYTLTNPES